MKFVQAETSSGCWTLPKPEGKKKPLWAIPAKRKVGGPGSAFYSLEDATSGTRKGLRGLVIDEEGRVYGFRKCDRPKQVEKSQSWHGKVAVLGKRLVVETDYQVFEREDGSHAMVEVLKLNEVPPQVREAEVVKKEPERVAAPVYQIPVHPAPPSIQPLTGAMPPCTVLMPPGSLPQQVPCLG